MRISIVIPVREDSPYLAEALASLAAQTRPPDEIVLGDALTGEGSEAFADARTVVVRRERAGAAAARNDGIAAASGDLIGFLDADDVAVGHRLERHAALLEAHPALAVVVGMTENFLSPDCAHLAGRVEFARGAQSAWHVGALLTRRETIERIGGFDEQLPNGEAVEWLERVRRHAGPVRELGDVVLRRRVHDANEPRLRRTEVHAGYLATARAAIERRRGGVGG